MNKYIYSKLSIALCAFSVIGCGSDGSSANAPPTASISTTTTSVLEADTFTIKGVGSDADGTISTIQWTQTAGPAAILSGENSYNLSVTAPNVDADTKLTFSLSVTDNDGDSDSATYSISVLQNLAPVVNAGDDISLEIDSPETILLSAQASDNEDNIDVISWTQIEGPAVTIINGDTLTPEFEVSDSGDDELLKFVLTVTDELGDSANDEVSVTLLTPKLKVLTSDLPEFGKPKYVLNGRNANMEIFQNSLGNTKQILYTSNTGNGQYRMILDPDTGEISKIIDQLSGNYIAVVENGADRVDFLEFDVLDQYQKGTAVYFENDVYYTANIAGTAAFEGQISGQMIGNTQTGSYVLIASKTATLTDIQVLPAEIVAMLNNIQDNSANALSAKSTFNKYAVKSSAISLSRLLKIAGVAGIGLASTSVLAPAYGAAGVAMLIAGFASDEIGDYINDNFHSEIPFVQEQIDLLVDHLQSPGATSLKDMWTKVINNIGDVEDFIDEKIEKFKNNLTTFTDIDEFELATDNTSDELDELLIPDSADQPPVIEVDLDGQAVLQDGTVYNVEGSLNENGDFSVSGDATNMSGDSITINGNLDDVFNDVSGVFTTDNESGSVDGNSEELGQCSQSQGSGGQGTFSYAHNVGASGNISFYYDAYSIPDAFTVSSSDGVLFDTGGLVSGNDLIEMTVTSPIVFVSVSAPRSGTAWEYQVSCAQ